MADWRSEPPDEAGWWLWRAKRHAPPIRFHARLDDDGRLELENASTIWWCKVSGGIEGGQWLKVPE